MKLSKIYANQEKFKTIHFNSGLNIIYGDISSEDHTDGTVEEHNLGKTSLVHLISFLLLEKIDQNSYFIAFSEKFLNWEFYLEIKLNDGKYVTIRRSVGDYNKIAFKRHELKDQDFTDEEEWDYKDLSIHTIKDEINPIKIFEKEYLKFDVQNEFGFRSFLSYVLRTQDDYSDVFKLNKFQGGDSLWKPQLLDLFGFDYKLLDRKYEIDDEIKSARKVISKLQTTDEDDKYELRAAIEAKEGEKAEAQRLIDQFNFYTQDNEINRDLVKDIEQRISLLNDKKYSLTYDIDQIQQSLDTEQPHSLEVEDLQNFFNEIEVAFPNALKKEYSEVIAFSRQLSEEREKYLKDELRDLQKHLRNANSQLRDLDIQRAEMLSSLTQKDSFNKFKQYQSRLALIDNQIFTFKQQLRDIERIELLKEEQDKRKEQLDIVKQAISVMLDNDPNEYISIRKQFTDIYRRVFEYTGTLIVKLNTKGNITFQPLVFSDKANQNMTGKSKGYTSRRIMCVSFILAVMATYADKSFYRFAYNDGIMEGWGDGHKRSFIELVRQYAVEYDIQYITSVIKSDIPDDFEFIPGEIVRTLTKDDTLFNVDF